MMDMAETNIFSFIYSLLLLLGWSRYLNMYVYVIFTESTKFLLPTKLFMRVHSTTK